MTKKVKRLVLILLLVSQARAGEQRSVNQPPEPETFFPGIRRPE